MKRWFEFGIWVVAFFVWAGSAHASYYETWLVEGKVLEVLDPKATAELQDKRPDLSVDPKHARAGLKIQLTKCRYVEGHGNARCKVGQVETILLGFEKEAHTGNFKPGMKLKIRYFYSNSAVPAGHVAESRIWVLEKP